MTVKKRTKPEYWEDAKKFLRSKDSILKSIIDNTDNFNHLQKTCTPFQTVANAIIGQQISIAAAESITKRIKKACGVINKDNILRSSSVVLKKTGLSSQKIKYLKGLANHVEKNKNFFKILETKSDLEVSGKLCELYGVGVWTAEMYLIFQLLRPNVLPLGDIGLINSINKAYNIKNSSIDKIKKISKCWEPYRTVAVWYMWRVIDSDIVEY
tara:strand:+ start:128 stop:763 length:636 start_codon:yes stop_codon:yes gene_type:complete